MPKKKQVLAAILAITIIVVIGTGVVAQMQNTQPIRIACVGDSITSGFQYPENLQKLLGHNYEVTNFGLGGTTVTLESETPYMRDPIFGEAKDSQPDIVVIMLGTNDASPGLHRYNGSFVNDYTALINEFKNLDSKPRIWLVKPPPIFYNGTGLSTDFLSQNVIPNIEEVAQKTSLPTIDVYSALKDHPDYFYDGVHPNSAGSMAIANEVYKAITSK